MQPETLTPKWTRELTNAEVIFQMAAANANPATLKADPEKTKLEEKTINGSPGVRFRPADSAHKTESECRPLSQFCSNRHPL